MAVKFKIKVTPKASRNAVIGWMGDELKVAVTAAPEKGKANKAVVKVLANVLGVPKKSVRILAGATSAHKIVEVDGVNKSSFLEHCNS